MSKMRNIALMILVVSLLSLAATGCKSGGSSGYEEHPQKDTERPKGDHPKH